MDEFGCSDTCCLFSVALAGSIQLVVSGKGIQRFIPKTFESPRNQKDLTWDGEKHTLASKFGDLNYAQGCSRGMPLDDKLGFLGLRVASHQRASTTLRMLQGTRIQ